MMVDTTVYALIGDAEIVHNNETCAGDVLQSIDGSHTFARQNGDGSFDELRPVYYLDDDGSGLPCDACGLYIFEPNCPECGDDSTTDDRGEPELCSICLDNTREAARRGDDLRFPTDKAVEAYEDELDAIGVMLDNLQYAPAPGQLTYARCGEAKPHGAHTTDDTPYWCAGNKDVLTEGD